MNKIEIYKQLESKMLKYVDLINIPVEDIGEKLVLVDSNEVLSANPISNNFLEYSESGIYIRETVLNKLKRIGVTIKSMGKEYELEVVYGYRSLQTQKKLFNKFRSKFNKTFSGIDLLEAVHRNIAVPEVSGHPTGGAVDVQILKANEPIDFGTKIWEFCKDSYSFSPYISTLAKKNRRMLRDLMLEEGFAPFDGEWWHYSYGDREWAKYYNKSPAIYGQLFYLSKGRFAKSIYY